MFVMEFIVYRFSQCATNPAHFCEVINACRHNPLQAAKLTQQFTPFLGSKARYPLQRRCLPCLRTTLAMTRNREAVRFVSNLLNQQ